MVPCLLSRLYNSFKDRVSLCSLNRLGLELAVAFNLQKYLPISATTHAPQTIFETRLFYQSWFSRGAQLTECKQLGREIGRSMVNIKKTYQLLTGCDSASPAMAAQQWKSPRIQQLFFEAGCLIRSSVCAGILKEEALVPVKEWTCQQEQAGKEELPSLCPLQRLPLKGVTQVKGGSSLLR